MNCTTAAQYFHLLRRQAALLTIDPLPLFVLTPKSLLRNPHVASSPAELEEGRFQSVIDDAEARTRAKSIKRLVLCSGKVYVDLISSERRAAAKEVAIVRVEQLYPFPKAALSEVLSGYTSLDDVVWLQEEPENMGAWEFMRPAARGADRRTRAAALYRPHAQLEPVGRIVSVAPAQSEGARRAGVRSRESRLGRFDGPVQSRSGV